MKFETGYLVQQKDWDRIHFELFKILLVFQHCRRTTETQTTCTLMRNMQGVGMKVTATLRKSCKVKEYRNHYVYRKTWQYSLLIEIFTDTELPLIPALIDAYTTWKYSPPPHIVTYTDPDASPLVDGRDFDINILDIHDLARVAVIPCGEDDEGAVALVTYRRGYRSAISDAFDTYIIIRRHLDSRVAHELGQDTQNYRVLSSCPPCNYELKDEPPLKFSRMFVLDGNNSLKRMQGAGNRQVADDRVYQDSDYFLPEEYVNQFGNEVPRGRTQTEDEDAEEPGLEQGGDPTDGQTSMSETSPLQKCTSNWKAAAGDAAKKMWDGFHETGIFASACRHGFIIWLTDMIRSGELAALEQSYTAFRIQEPEDFEQLPPHSSYSSGLSETRKTETCRRFLGEKRDNVLWEILQMESQMDVRRRWTPLDSEYKAALKYMTEHKYLQALENLHLLVIKQLFEMHKLNMSGTGFTGTPYPGESINPVHATYPHTPSASEMHEPDTSPPTLPGHNAGSSNVPHSTPDDRQPQFEDDNSEDEGPLEDDNEFVDDMGKVVDFIAGL
ncbi:hypothetical protein HHX47_DHR4001030 [Lentinula edodes]|nr:hypothetical protein HHX47_DHR4001030 [Lentinula edodes]